MEDKEIKDIDLAKEDSDKTVLMVGGPGIIYSMQVNSEAWQHAIEAFKKLGEAADASFELIKPMLRELGKAAAEYRDEMVKEWVPAQNFFFEGGARTGLVAAMNEITRQRQEDMLRQKAEFLQVSLPFETDIKFEDLDPRWLELIAKIEKEQVEQKQLHKKKGKKVKNWEHTKFWQGR